MSPPLRPPIDDRDELEGGFSRRALAWVAGLTAVALVLAGLLLFFRGGFGSGLGLAGGDGRPNAGPNTFSYSALGHRGLAELLRATGLGVVSRRNPVEGSPGLRHPLVLAEPAVESPAAEARLRTLMLEAARRGAPLVLVLPKWESMPDPRHPGWIAGAALRPVSEVQRAFRTLGLAGLERVRVEHRGRAAARECAARFGGRYTVFRTDLRPAQLLIPSAGLDPVVVCGTGLLVARVAAAPFVFLVSDPDLLNNQGLGRADHAALVDDLLTTGLRARGVIFDETVHGLSRRAGISAEALRFPLVFAVAQAALLTGLMVWAGLGRFGKPLPIRSGPGDGTEVLIDNTAQLLSVGGNGGYRRHGGHAAESLARYYRQTVRAVAAACFLPPDLPEEEILGRLQQIAESRGSPLQLRGFARRVAEVAAAGPAAGDRAVRLARILHRWSREMGNGHREHP